MNKSIAIGIILLFSLLARTGHASKDLPSVPVFSSLKADRVNLRCGPGFEYEVLWVFVRRGWPVKVVETFENWKKIEDKDKVQGWVHKSMMAQTRTVLVTAKPEVLLRKRAAHQATPIARIRPGVIGRLDHCTNQYCRIRVLYQEKVLKGWVPQAALWGVDAP